MSESPQQNGADYGTARTDPRNNGKGRLITESSVVQSRPLSGRVALRVPADAEPLGMLRALTETVMLTADFTIDVVIDVRVALDEVATTLIAGAVPDASIDCEFLFDEQRVRVRVAAVTHSDGGVLEHSFGWQVVETLTESIAVRSDDFDPARNGYRVVVEFTRTRGDSDEG